MKSISTVAGWNSDENAPDSSLVAARSRNLRGINAARMIAYEAHLSPRADIRIAGPRH